MKILFEIRFVGDLDFFAIFMATPCFAETFKFITYLPFSILFSPSPFELWESLEGQGTNSCKETKSVKVLFLGAECLAIWLLLPFRDKDQTFVCAGEDHSTFIWDIHRDTRIHHRDIHRTFATWGDS